MNLFIKKLAVAFMCLLLGSCAALIKRQAHFIPVYDGRILLSGEIRFIHSSDPVAYLTPEMKHAPKAQVLRMADGSVKVTWMTTMRKHEKLMYIDNGVHPVEIPKGIIQEAKDLDTEIPSNKPCLLYGFGETTAFIKDFIKLGEPIKAKKRQEK